jgi:hypothetical protein
MEGIRYIINDKGEKKAAVIDLDTYGHLWDDIHDILIVESRKSEPKLSTQADNKKVGDTQCGYKFKLGGYANYCGYIEVICNFCLPFKNMEL